MEIKNLFSLSATIPDGLNVIKFSVKILDETLDMELTHQQAEHLAAVLAKKAEQLKTRIERRAAAN